MLRSSHIRWLRRGIPVLALLLLVGCGESPREEAYVARVGEEVLTEDDLTEALAALPTGLDRETARSQYVEQWITGQLLALEARRRGLVDDPDVQRQLRENERNVLAAFLLNVLYDEEATAPDASALEDYFERNRERMQLREPYVRVRFVEARSSEDAEAARRQMIALYTGGHGGAAQDSLFLETVHQFSIDTTAAAALASSYVPQSRLLRQTGGGPWSVVPQLGARETSPIAVTPDSTFFVVQLVDRVPVGGEPRLEWVAEEVSRRLAIQTRQEMVARELHRLRSEALARGDLSLASEEP